MPYTIFSHMLTSGLVITGHKRIYEGTLLIGDIQVKEMSREMGVSKLSVKCLFSLTLVKQNELVWLYKRDY